MVARVNGVDIRQSDIALAEEDLGAEMQQVPPDQKRDHLITYLADIIMVSQAAEQKKLSETDEFKRRLAMLRNKVLMGLALQDEVKSALTDEAFRKVYDEAVKTMTPQEEVRARHILVENEDEAKAIAEQIKGGADFATLAKEKSKDPGAADGGDLGYFTKDQMVPEFADVAFKMYPGQVSNPVKSAVRLARHQARRQAPAAGAGVREGQGPDRDLPDPQGADRLRRQAAAERQDRAPRQARRGEARSRPQKK